MRRFRATKRPSQGTRHKMPNSREAVLEALAMDDNEPAPVKHSSTIVRHHAFKKRVCASPGCYVQHTPIWWGGTEKKICQRCHQKNS